MIHNIENVKPFRPKISLMDTIFFKRKQLCYFFIYKTKSYLTKEAKTLLPALTINSVLRK